MSECPETEIDSLTIDTSEAQVALKQLEVHGKITAAHIQSLIHKSYASLRVMAEMVAIVVPQWVDMMVASAYMMVNTFKALGSALATAGVINPIFLLQATMAFIAATMMAAQTLALLVGAEQMAGQTQLMLTLMNTWSY